MIYLDVSINFAQPIKAGVEQAGKDLGVKTIFDGSVNFNLDQQVAIIENYITKKVDGMAIAPLSSEVIDPLINKAIDAGIPVVTFNTDSPTSNRIAFFGQDLITVAREQGEMIAKLINKKGTVLITSCDAAAPWSQMREQGVREGLAKFPGIKVIENICNAKGDEQTTYAAIENAMLANRGAHRRREPRRHHHPRGGPLHSAKRPAGQDRPGRPRPHARDPRQHQGRAPRRRPSARTPTPRGTSR